MPSLRYGPRGCWAMTSRGGCRRRTIGRGSARRHARRGRGRRPDWDRTRRAFSVGASRWSRLKCGPPAGGSSRQGIGALRDHEHPIPALPAVTSRGPPPLPGGKGGANPPGHPPSGGGAPPPERPRNIAPPPGGEPRGDAALVVARGVGPPPGGPLSPPPPVGEQLFQGPTAE